MARFLGIDVGTSGTKAVLIDEHGTIIKSAQADYPLSTPQPGWAEQDPEDWWAAVQWCTGEIGGRPDAIGVTGQMHGSVFLDDKGQVVRPALLWCDQRTELECQEIESAVGPEVVRRVTCNPMLTGFQLPKIIWLRKHEPTAWNRLRKVLLPKDFIVHRLTGIHSTDVSDASGVGLLDVHRREWSGELMQGLGLDPALFPACSESAALVGRTPEGTPVVAGAGDQAAGAVGTGAVVPEVTSLSLGTSGVAFCTVPTPVSSPDGSVHVFCRAQGGWHAMAVMLSCGGALRWVRDTFFPGQSFDQMASAASKSRDKPPVFLPTLAGERSPFVDPRATGALVGLGLHHTASDVAAAVYGGVTTGLLACLAKLKSFGESGGRLHLTGGGAASAYWCQLIADGSGRECHTLEADEGPAFGAAILAGVGVGHWDSPASACASCVRVKSSYRPQQNRPSLDFAAYESLHDSLKDWAERSNELE